MQANPHWDYNSAWQVVLGGCEPFAADTGWTYPLTCWIHGTNYPVPFWWKRLLEDSTYTRDMKCRWKQLRASTFSTANIYHIMDSVANYVSLASTSYYSQFSLTQNYQTEVNNLKTWIGNRLAWLDAHMPGNCWNTGVDAEFQSESILYAFIQIHPTANFSCRLSVISRPLPV